MESKQLKFIIEPRLTHSANAAKASNQQRKKRRRIPGARNLQNSFWTSSSTHDISFTYEITQAMNNGQTQEIKNYSTLKNQNNG